ncbi:MAG: GGDEF domain-containing protein [Pseudomonadota bacterium]|nr:GGDEF domain-containing protein [Pseudomonadota bacterium]
MDLGSRRWWQAIAIIAVMLLAPGVPAQGFSVARLDADPVPARILAGEFDEQFVEVDDATVIHEQVLSPRWWRLTAEQAFPASTSPQLVLSAPYLSRVEVWTPGRIMPAVRALVGPHADFRYSTRALVTSLPEGLKPGQEVYIRLKAEAVTAMPVAIEPLDEVHRKDLLHVAWRTAVLSTMIVLSILALGFWIGVGERSYAYLMITLLAQVCYFLSVGGEWRGWPWMAEMVATDPRASQLFGLISLIASIHFLGFYLELRERQPRLRKLMYGCSIAAALLLAVTVFSHARWIGVLANVVVLVAAVAILVGSTRGARMGQRSARFLLLSWVPLLLLLVSRVGEVLGLWVGPAWTGLYFPAAFAFAGLVITVGLADKMHQLRRDRDHASRLASYDALTGATSRAAIDEQLRSAVADAHRTGRPLSVVFFDIDRFKQINDQHGHRVGDQCLRIIAMRTRNRLRTYDRMGRYGGDELVVVLPDTELHEAVGVAENLRSAINCRPLSIDGVTLEASLSLGVAQLAVDETAVGLLERADAALYESKSAGRDRVSSRVTGTHRAMPQGAVEVR